MTFNFEKHERDDPNHIDICRDKYGNLVTGVIPGLAPIADYRYGSGPMSIRNHEPERLPVREGDWYNAAGVAAMMLSNSRTHASGDVGFRSAYCEKLKAL